MDIVNSLLTWYMRKRAHQRELFLKFPHEVQAEWLRKLLSAAQNTEYGKQYAFEDLKDWRQFASRVPVVDYEAIEPTIGRLMRGEQGLLWPSEVKWFAKSSGTTSSKSKFIPVSNEALEECHFKAGKDMLSIYCGHRPDSRIFTGKALSVGGSRNINQNSQGSYYGDLSALLIHNLPLWAELHRTPNIEVALMDEWEAKIDRMARITMEQDVTNIQGVPSWSLVLLRKVLELTGKKSISEVWPNLEVFFHGGVSFTPYRSQFKELISSAKVRYMETYNASEGFFGIQDQTENNELLLLLDYGIYYEFIPTDAMDDRPIPLWEVELGRAYALVITTNAGLWRYKLGDTIKFTSIDPYRFVISGRTRHFINAFGEEVVAENADRALQLACDRTGASIADYTAAPLFYKSSGTGAHEWVIEFNQLPENLDFFAQTLDNALKALNSDYEAKRYKDMVLGPPIVLSAPHQTFYNWLKSKGKLGGQHKVPRLMNDRAVIEEVKQIASL